ncbi:hypothetical protein D3C76_1266530 [compost metagenome]
MSLPNFFSPTKLLSMNFCPSLVLVAISNIPPSPCLNILSRVVTGSTPLSTQSFNTFPQSTLANCAGSPINTILAFSFIIFLIRAFVSFTPAIPNSSVKTVSC